MNDSPVSCCEAGAHHLKELPNDQQADPGWRHIRLHVQSNGFDWSTSARYCPWCGFAFTEAPPAEAASPQTSG
jgi:hypothetical protein